MDEDMWKNGAFSKSNTENWKQYVAQLLRLGLSACDIGHTIWENVMLSNETYKRYIFEASYLYIRYREQNALASD